MKIQIELFEHFSLKSARPCKTHRHIAGSSVLLSGGCYAFVKVFSLLSPPFNLHNILMSTRVYSIDFFFNFFWGTSEVL